MFESLSGKLQGVFASLGRRGAISEDELDAALREVRLALLEADVNYKVARDYIKAVRARAATPEVLRSPTPLNRLIEIINDELISLLGADSPRLQRASQPPTIILMVGLQGSGKTTSAAKLALRSRKAGDRPLLIAADIYRPAAIDQLQALGKQLDIEVFDRGADTPPAQIVKAGLDRAAELGAATVIVDTAGRLVVDDAMMAEIADLRQRFKPTEVLLVADAMSGQDAVNAAQAFHDAVEISGVVLSKMDGDARGGAALSIVSVTGIPIKFIGTGESVDALEEFHPDRLASRILGMGDVLTLIEKTEAAYDREQAAALERKIRKATFDLNDFREQLEQLKKMGGLSQLLAMLPGTSALKGKIPSDDLTDKRIRRTEAIIFSMTPQERLRPDIIDVRRRRRIALGSGTTTREVSQLVNQFKRTRKIMRQMSSKRGMQDLLKRTIG